MVNKVRFSSTMFASALALATLLHAQDASSAAAAKQAYNKVIGAVVSVAPDGKSLIVKPDTGANATVVLDETTSYMQVPPGEKDLRKATRIELKDVAPGDRVYARSRKIEGQDATPAVSVIVMSKTEVAQHQEKNAAEWQRRGAAGRIKAIDAAAKTITVSVQARGGAHDLTIQTDAKTTFRRYAPDSVKFADAQPSDFATLAVGNNVRVLGDKNEDGTSIHAEELVSGSFRNLAGTVISVDAANNQVKVNDLQTKKPVTISVNSDTNLRKLPQQMAMMIAARARAASGNAAGAPGAGPGMAPAGASATKQSQTTAQGGPDSKPGFNGPGVPAVGGPPAGAGGWAGRSGGGAGGGMDLNRALEQAPQMALTDLKPGDALMISSTNGADASRVTAIAVIGGVEPILAASPSSSGQSALSGAMTLDIGMPQ